MKTLRLVSFIMIITLLLNVNDISSDHCYKKDNQNDLLSHCEIPNIMQRYSYCKSICTHFKFNYGGPRGINYCCCGDKLLSKTNAAMGCTDSCGENSGETCGSESTPLIADLQYAESTLQKKNEYFELGCFSKTSYFDEIDIGEVYPLFGLRNWDHDKCFEICDFLKEAYDSNIKYASFSVHKQEQFCICSNDQGSTMEVSKSECDSRCLGNEDENCGSKRTVMIYKMNDFCFLYDAHHTVTSSCEIPNFLGTSSFCNTICGASGYKYGGPRGSSFCCCGDDYASTKKISYNNCFKTCKNSAEFCGDEEAAYMKTIEKKDSDLQVMYNYYEWGCYPRSSFANESVDGKFYIYTGLKNWYHKFCFGACEILMKNIKYVGLTVHEGYQACLCSTEMEDEEQLDDKYCNRACSGDTDQYCGDDDNVWLFSRQAKSETETKAPLTTREDSMGDGLNQNLAGAIETTTQDKMTTDPKTTSQATTTTTIATTETTSTSTTTELTTTTVTTTEPTTSTTTTLPTTTTTPTTTELTTTTTTTPTTTTTESTTALTTTTEPTTTKLTTTTSLPTTTPTTTSTTISTTIPTTSSPTIPTTTPSTTETLTTTPTTTIITTTTTTTTTTEIPTTTTSLTTTPTTSISSTTTEAPTTTSTIIPTTTTISTTVTSTESTATTEETTTIPTTTAIEVLTTTAPTTKSVLPTEAPAKFQYPVTSDYYFPSLQVNSSECPSEGALKLVSGPFGFGHGVSAADCCPHIQNFAFEKHFTCFNQPSECLDGFSLSLWENIAFKDDSTNERYLFSTGGDLDGNPGVAVYHKGVDLCVIVSNGTHYWNLSAAGPIYNNTWSNIGIIWKEDLGLELYVDAIRIAALKYPNNEEILRKKEINLKAKPEVIIGCKLNKEKSPPYFENAASAEFDEVSIWMSAVNDSRHFLGGYDPAAANFTLERIKQLLKDKNVDILGKDNMPLLMKLLNKMTKKGSSTMEGSEPEPEPPRQTNGIEVILYEKSSDEADENVITTTISPENGNEALLKKLQKLEHQHSPEARAQSLETVVDIIKLLGENIPEDMNTDDLEENLGLLDIASNVFSQNYVEDWKFLQKNNPDASANIVSSLLMWGKDILSNTSLADDKEKYTVVKTTTNLVMSGLKITSDKLQQQRGVILPNYNRPEWNDVDWNEENLDDGLKDTIKIPENILNHVGDKEPGNIAVLVFNTFNQFAPLSVPKKRSKLPKVRTFIDGKILSLGISPTKGLEKILSVQPITVTISHVKKETALRRKLLFHDKDKIIPTVKRRYCTRWESANEKQNGSWTTKGCELLADKADFTMCDCRTPGIYAIIAQEILRKDIVPDPEWLWITKYVGYGLSAIFLIIYITIILCSKHLKDQFHIMRVHLSIAILGGMACLCATDFFRGMRHECTAITAVMQYMYTAAGMWLLMEGLALFLAMICGYVGGRLKAYVPLSWGFPALLLGLAMIADMEDYGLEKRCMISWNDDLKWLFFGPMLASGSLGFMFCTLSILNVSFTKLKTDFYVEDLGSVAKGLFCVLILYLLSWSFACLAYLDIEQVDPDFYPIFQVLNSALGILIFLFMGIGSKKFRLVITKKMPQYQSLIYPSDLVPVKPQPKH